MAAYVAAARLIGGRALEKKNVGISVERDKIVENNNHENGSSLKNAWRGGDDMNNGKLTSASAANGS